MTRCRNCGDPYHLTQHCPRFGPWYPEPGKTAEDYKDKAAYITTLVAQDILNEHEPHEDEPDGVVRVHTLTTEAAARMFPCKTCGVEVGSPCLTASGKRNNKSHMARLRAAA